MKNRLAVNMLVLNGAATLRRCLIPLKGVIDELVVVDSGSTDDTLRVLEDLVVEMKLDRFYYERMHPYSDHFFTDEAETWKMVVPGPFTGRRILKDWARARNLALYNTRADYVLKLDADDEPISGFQLGASSPAENWLRTANCLDVRPHISIVAAPYEIFDGKGNYTWLSMYDRMWRRVPADGSIPPRWFMSCHEYLSGKTPQNTLYTVQGLRVRDWRDSPGVGVRVAHRNLKVLLWDYEHMSVTMAVRESEDQKTVRLFTLAHEAAEVFPEFAIELLVDVATKIDPSDVGMLSDCYYHRARAEEAQGNVGSAISLYEQADKTSPHVQALLCEYVMLVRAGELASLSAEGQRPEGQRPEGQRPEGQRPEGQRPKGHRSEETVASPRACKLREKIFARIGADLSGPVPFNCDLGFVARVRGDIG